MLDSIYGNGSVNDLRHWFKPCEHIWGYFVGVWPRKRPLILHSNSHYVAQPDKLQRERVCQEDGTQKKNHNTQLGSSGRGVGKPSTTSVCVIRQLRGLLVYRSRERNRVSKAKHWLAAFLNEIFSLTSTLNFLFLSTLAPSIHYRLCRWPDSVTSSLKEMASWTH